MANDKPIPRQGAFIFDEHRNTSRVWPVPKGSAEIALRALRTIDPALREWIEDGHPTLTETEHMQRFGVKT